MALELGGLDDLGLFGCVGVGVGERYSPGGVAGLEDDVGEVLSGVVRCGEFEDWVIGEC